MKKVFLLFALGLAGLSASAADFTNADYIKQWGALTLKGNQLSSSKTGNAVQLKGWSSFGAYDENCVNGKEDLLRMKGMGANVVRIAKYFDTGYGVYDDQTVLNFMKWSNEVGIYCVVDWHILEKSNSKKSGNPLDYTNEAKQFFTKIAQEVKNKGYEHVIYELCNEPSGCSADQIKTYAEQVIDVIAQYDQSKPIVIVGTPSWDQNIYTVTYNNGKLVNKKDKANVMYAFHLYANEAYHQTLMQTEFVPATQVMPVFVSEWGMSSAEPELVSYDKRRQDINEGVSNTFMAYCNGEGGSGQVVSWCNWSYGNKHEGSSTFDGACEAGANDVHLSPSGKYIVGILGGESNPSIPKGACYQGACLELSKSSKEEILNLGYYDQNPEGTEAYGNSSMVTYYDANNTSDENYDEKSKDPYDPYKLVSATDKGSGNKEGMVIQCYAGRAWCNHRLDECVDVTGVPLDGKWGSQYGLGWISSGEWVNYTFDVADPGYYSLEMAVPENTAGYGKVIENDDETVTYQAGASFSMSLVDHASQTFMVDIDKSSETAEVSLEESANKTEFAPKMVPTGTSKFNSDPDQNPSNDRIWTPCATGAAGNKVANHGILFKEAGKHVVRVTFNFGHKNLGGLRFTYAKPWNGEGYPEEVVDPGTGVESAVAAGVSVYPTVVENGVFNVVAEGEAEVSVSNMAGSVVYATSVNGNSAINANLAAGVYNVKVVSANEVSTAKIIVK